jgi:flagellar biosynthesis protein FlhF
VKVKRFSADTMRQAMAQVRQELGDDAVIISSRQLDRGVEVVVSLDARPTTSPSAESSSFLRPELVSMSHQQDLDRMAQDIQALKSLVEQQLSSLAWGQVAQAKPAKMRLIKRLMAIGLSVELCQKLVADCDQDEDQAWSFLMQDIESMLPIMQQDVIEQGGIIALVGPTGVGKTTSIAKIASRFVLRYGASHLALITTDCYKIGAQEQLKTFADLIGVPVYIANTQVELNVLLDTLTSKRLILIDTAGMSQRDLHLSRQLTAGQSPQRPLRNLLVLSAATQLNVMRDIVHSFGQVTLHGCILTKLDEALQLGHAMNVLIDSGLPLAYTSVGQRVPEDLQRLSAHELVDRAMLLGQQNLAQNTTDYDQLLKMGWAKEVSGA